MELLPELKCEGYSSAEYLWIHYPELHEFLDPIVKTNPNAKLYPCHLITHNDNTDYYVIRIMGKNKNPIIDVKDKNNNIQFFHAITRKAPVTEIDLNELYEHREFL
jgi:hypothetical protein